MKRLSALLFIIIIMVYTSRAQSNVGINDDNSNPKASAMLDVYSTTKGLLIPRIALTSTAVAAPVTSPEASLLIYNTAATGNVTPGYYYWDGTSKWVRLVANGDPLKNFNMVTKTANSTLLKSENIVLASGDVTITLPTVTSTDDGLEITVKNAGTVTDLITIVAETNKTIDGIASEKLTRWRSQTFVATGTNWIVKEKVAPTDNVYVVSSSGSFTTIAEIVEFLTAHTYAHMTGPTIVELGGGNYSIAATQTIDFPYPVTFKGSSYGETKIFGASGVSGTPLFDCKSECYFKMLDFTAYSNAAGNIGLRFPTNGTYHEIKDCSFTGFNKGIVSKNAHSLLWIFEVTFVNCTGAGIEIDAGANSGGALKVSECLFEKCAIGINLLSGVAGTISIHNSNFYNTTPGTDVGINYTPDTFTASPSIFISGNAWNNQGTFFGGFDFTRSDGRDANVFMINNLGKENENPHCKIAVNNNTSTTTITNLGTFYKANWTNTSTYTCKFTVDNNKITYQPNNTTDVWSIITGNLSVSDNKVITLAIYKNGITGTRYGDTDLRIATNNAAYQFSTIIYISDMKPGDYLELFVTSSSNNDVVTFRDVNWYTDSH